MVVVKRLALGAGCTILSSLIIANALGFVRISGSRGSFDSRHGLRASLTKLAVSPARIALRTRRAEPEVLTHRSRFGCRVNAQDTKTSASDVVVIGSGIG
eukprot:1392129-Amorphochlora_amoeboformis.AAC.2